jgi:hypothetical protein
MKQLYSTAGLLLVFLLFLMKGPTTSLVTRHTQDFQINHSLPSSLRLFVDPDPTTTYF